MHDAAVHFLEVCATLVSISTDIVVWWTAAMVFTHRRLPAAHIGEVGLRCVAALVCMMYGARTSQFGILASYTSCAVGTAALWMTHYRALIANNRAREHAGTSLGSSLKIGLGMFAAVCTVAVVLSLTYYQPYAPRGAGIAAILLSGACALASVWRVAGPQEHLDVDPIRGDDIVNVGRIIGALFWVTYGIVYGDVYVVFMHVLLAFGSAAILFVAAVGLRLPRPAKPSTSTLWGPEPKYELCPEDTASLISDIYYSWAEPYAISAAHEDLPFDRLPQPTEATRTWSLGRNLVAQMGDELTRFHSWDCILNVAQVRASWDPNSVGTLRWVGCLSRSPTPNAVMAGIEWEVKPTQCRGLWGQDFHNGTFDEEVLFSQRNETYSNSSCIPIEMVRIASLPQAVPPTPVAPSVVRALFTSTWGLIFIQAPFRMTADICMLSAPVVLEAFVKFLNSDDPSVSYGLLLVGVVVLTGLVQSSLLHRFYHTSIRAGIAQRNAVLGALFAKCLNISPRELAHPDMGAGRVVNMVSSDAERFNDFQQMLLYFWSYPFQVAFGIMLLYRLVGWCAIGSIFALLVAVPLQGKVAELQHRYRQELVKHSDQRVKLTNELFGGIRIVKFMGWELNFVERLRERRCEELLYLKKTQYCRIWSSLITAATPMMLVAAVFILYHLDGKELTPEVVFPTIAVLNLLRIPFLMIPMLFTTLIQFSVAAGRITRFLSCDDQSENAVESLKSYLERLPTELTSGAFAKDYAAVLDGATLSAYVPVKLPTVERHMEDTGFIANCKRSFCGACVSPPKPKLVAPKGNFFTMQVKPLLTSVSLKFPRNKLTVIVGPTGSGKSTMLESLLGQLDISSGIIASDANMAYVSQQPWIMNATVRDNILFFSDLKDERLSATLAACQLEADLHVLPGGLDTEIGEKGVNLSGGQCARVSMARAVYAGRDLYLLDDPLSALDAHVGAALFNECILGILSNTTRILATHHVHILPKADFIVELGHDGDIHFTGTYTEYLAAHGGAALSTPTETQPGGFTAQTSASPTKAAVGKAEKLMTSEEKASGSVPLTTYAKYFKACGGVAACVFVIVVFLLTEFLIVANTVWLSLWSVQTFSLSQNTYLFVYLGVISVGIVSAPLRYRVAYDVMRRASYHLHQDLLSSVVRAPMAFFDTTPLGRILNRFVQDIDQADNGLQMSMVMLLQMFFSSISTTIMIVTAQPVALVVLAPCCLIYYRLLTFYNAANREARRIGNVVKSPVFSLLTEVLNGAKTIRAYGKSESIMHEAMKRLDVTYSATYLQNILNRWLGVRIEMLGTAIVGTVALGTAMSKLYGFGTSNVAILALGLTMSSTITSMLNWIIRQVSAVESDMNSIERIIHYSEAIDQEELDLVPSTAEPDATLSGTVEFRHVEMRYRPDLPLVLRNLSFSINAGEKVGIVGRTGSGKSSLLLTFLRIIEICGGSIVIGGKPLSSFSLANLRRLFAMIPQDPILFDGTVRSNLDPFLEHAESDIVRALSLVGMDKKILSEPLGISSVVLDGGSNFSVGQRQLLCMARAILKKGCLFILMDEATANIDPALDRTIQKAVKTAFVGQTVITIAHRLHTIAAYDKVIVMDQGTAAEIASPRELFAKSDSRFRAMVDAQESGARDEIVEILSKTSN